MAVADLGLLRRALQSRVARRVFAVFAVCSLLPVGAFALFGFWQVRSHLEKAAIEGLRHASKAAGMSILERLMIAEAEMEVLGDALSLARGESRGVDGGRIFQMARRSLERAGSSLTDAQRASLASGRTILVSEPQAKPPARLRLLRLPEPGSPDVLIADLDPDFVFEPRQRIVIDRYWIEDEGGRVLFEAPAGAASAARKALGPGGSEAVSFEREGSMGPEVGATWSIFLRTRFWAPSWTVAFSRPAAEVHRPLREFETVFPLVAIAAFGLALLLSLSQIRRSLVPIDALTEATRRISAGELDARVAIRTGDEFAVLGRAFNAMTTEIARQVRVLSAMNRVGRALSAELDTDALLDLILRESMRVTDSRGAAIFLSLDGEPLSFARLRLGADEPTIPAQRGLELDPVVARRCLERSTTLSCGGVPELPVFERDAWERIESRIGFSIGAQVAVPMRDGRGDSIGVLILIRDTDGGGYSGESCELAESLASQAATAITKNHMVDGFRNLFEGVIQLTVRAIDAKSSYTADHCRNVPILTELIAEAACATTRGPLKNFALSDDERYELRIAALLHDCGKVATPVHVMDKATKLETIFDRIELVDTRFEVLRRDIATNAAGLGPEELERRLARLEQDRSFLRGCNSGSESMAEEDARRVHEIAERYHYTARDGRVQPVLTRDETLNLCVRRGTLNPSERKVIEEHVVTTIDLLSELPFPLALQAVPEIAGSHHERVDGSGYPRRLSRDEITLQGRILGLADVFEALTAKNRPYKPGRSLTETFRILDEMCAAGAIDPDLYELFKREKVYLPFVATSVAPEQIDGPYWEELDAFTGGV